MVPPGSHRFHQLPPLASYQHASRLDDRLEQLGCWALVSCTSQHDQSSNWALLHRHLPRAPQLALPGRDPRVDSTALADGTGEPQVVAWALMHSTPRGTGYQGAGGCALTVRATGAGGQR
jgi:hypothetical protein